MILSHRYLYNIPDKLHPRPFDELYNVVSDYRTFIHICRNKADMSSLEFDYQQSLHTQESVVEDACRFELGAENKRLYLFQGYFKIDDYIRQKIKDTGGEFHVEIEAIDVEDSHKSVLFRGDDNYVLYASTTSRPTNKEKVYIDSTKTSGGSFVKVKYSSGYYYEENIP